jgi:hypothetical protein
MNIAPTRRAALLSGVAFLSAGAAAVDKQNLKIAIFSKHLQFIERAQLAQAAAEMGFDGIDLTVRSGGHVEPARARRSSATCPLIRRHGLEVPMVTTDIVDADTPNARTVLKTIADLGIHNYRWGGFKYEADQPLSRQFAEKTCSRGTVILCSPSFAPPSGYSKWRPQR